MLKETESVYVYEKVVSEDMVVGRVKWLYHAKGAREIDSKNWRWKLKLIKWRKSDISFTKEERRNSAEHSHTDQVGAKQ